MIKTCNRARYRFGLKRALVQHLIDEHGHDFRAWWPKLIEMELGPSYVLAIQGPTKGDPTQSDTELLFHTTSRGRNDWTMQSIWDSGVTHGGLGTSQRRSTY